MNGRTIVGWNLRRLRVERGLTMETLAGDADVDPSYVARIERTTVNASVDVLERLVAVLGVRLADLFVEPAEDASAPKPLRGGRRAKR